MGQKRHQRNVRQSNTQVRSRQTRSKGRLLADPATNTQELTTQLRSLGLYAAPTLGDGNCLFRALSDQLYGSPSAHQRVRADICDWIEHNSSRYEGFCEDERGLATHLRCMREQGTYGGHLELSAFAHLHKRNVKVIQPGLVYVIEWDAGGTDPSSSKYTSSDSEDDEPEGARERRKARRERMRKKSGEAEAEEARDPSIGAVYVAYHDWEHFSSIRNLRGPHSGLPDVQELTVLDPSTSASVEQSKPHAHAREKRAPKLKSKRALAASGTGTPSQIPLPDSRSPSPYDTAPDIDIVPASPLPRSTSFSANTYAPSTSAISEDGLAVQGQLRVRRSPKRGFDESEGSGEGESEGGSETKRARRGTVSREKSKLVPADEPEDEDEEDEEEDDLESTPGLSAPGSSSSTSTSSLSLSAMSSPSPPPMPAPDPPSEKPLTRRQRKALGLPKPRLALSMGERDRKSAGRIVIPGGRYKVKATDTVAGAPADGEGEEEWRKSGVGRVDVRGFRELKI